MAIRNPVEWSWDQIRVAVTATESAVAAHSVEVRSRFVQPSVRRITTADLVASLRAGLDDFRADPTHYLFMCGVYPIIGLILARAAFGYDILPLVFPLIAGFALLGPLVAVGLYELSRLRERGRDVAWWDAFRVFSSPSIGAILAVGVILVALFGVWLIVADALYRWTFGPAAPASMGGFLHDLFTTGHGWALIVLGNGIGLLFAILALMIGVFSFPLLVDRDVSTDTALRTSIRAVRANPVVMAQWGLIVAGLLVLGSIPFLIGLVVVLPVLSHATWHLYRRTVGTEVSR